MMWQTNKDYPRDGTKFIILDDREQLECFASVEKDFSHSGDRYIISYETYNRGVVQRSCTEATWMYLPCVKRYIASQTRKPGGGFIQEKQPSPWRCCNNYPIDDDFLIAVKTNPIEVGWGSFVAWLNYDEVFVGEEFISPERIVAWMPIPEFKG